MDSQSIARALGRAQRAARGWVAKCPAHDDHNPSLSLCDTPDGKVLVKYHAGCEQADVIAALRARALWPDNIRSADPPKQPIAAAKPADDDGKRIADALAIWRDSVDPRGTLIERYLRSRGLKLGDDVAGAVLRWHPRIRAMIALFRNIVTDAPQAICRTFLDAEGRKIERKFLGPVGGAAIKLDSDDTVLGGLHIGEGVETCMAARQLGLRPAWAVGSAGAIAAFPVLSGIEALSLLREHDEANQCAADACAARWRSAGRQVLDVWPERGKDVNDTLGERA
jgi:putative DNA primase/helicase